MQRLAIICIFKMVNFSVSLSSFGSWLMANERNLSAFNLKFTPPYVFGYQYVISSCRHFFAWADWELSAFARRPFFRALT